MRTAILVLGLVGWVGCSGSSGGHDAGPDAGPGSDLPYVGSTVFIASGTVYTVGVTFLQNRHAPECWGTQQGSCCFVDGPLDAGVPVFVSGGDVQVTGAGVDTYPYSPDAMNHYAGLSSLVDPDLSWGGGDMLTVHANGVGASAGPVEFTATIAAADDIAGVSPVLPAPSGHDVLHLPTSTDFSMQWTPGSVAGARVALSISDGMTHQALTCQVPDSSGSLTVPAALLQRLQTNPLILSITRQNLVVHNTSNTAFTLFSMSATQTCNATVQ